MRLLQVCNVGQICGGTAACAWTVAHAWPEWQHTILFLSSISTETRKVCHGMEIEQVDRVDDVTLARHQPDLVILHNTPQARVGRIQQTVTLQYRHSQGTHAGADMTVSCSQWLNQRLDQSGLSCGREERTSLREILDFHELVRHMIDKTALASQAPVLYQPVPPTRPLLEHDTRHLSDELVAGRICTPGDRKWPLSALPVYAAITQQIPELRWEFVGCPTHLQTHWRKACENRVTFFPAGWLQRERLQRWHALIYHHPTLTESFGRTVAEAMSAGCVPLVDSRGGFCEQVEQGRTGFLCRTVDEFVHSAKTLRIRPDWWKCSLAAKQASAERFSLQAFRKTFRAQLTM